MLFHPTTACFVTLFLLAAVPRTVRAVGMSSCTDNEDGTGTVTCSDPTWTAGGSPADYCMYEASSSAGCFENRGACAMWCYAAGFGQCLDWSTASTYFGGTAYPLGGGCGSFCTKLSSVTCIASSNGVLRSMSSTVQSNLQSTEIYLSSGYCYTSPSIPNAYTCVDLTWDSNAGFVDQCWTSNGGDYNCDVGAVVCAALGLGSYLSSQIGETSSSTYASGATCSGTCYYFSSITCRFVYAPIVGPGSACLWSDDCSTDNCQGGYCCIDGVTSQCTACASGSGDCTVCNSQYKVSGGVCVDNFSPGVICETDVQCSTSLCRRHYCCASGVPATCEICAANTGDCLAATETRSVTLSLTESLTMTITPPAATPSASESASLSATATSSWTRSPSHSKSESITISLTRTNSHSVSPTHTASSTMSSTISSTVSDSVTGTRTLSPSVSSTRSGTQTMSPTETPSIGTPTTTATFADTPSDTYSMTNTMTQTLSHTPSATKSLTKTASLTFSRTVELSRSLSLAVTATATVTASAASATESETFTHRPPRIPVPAPAVTTVYAQPEWIDGRPSLDVPLFIPGTTNLTNETSVNMTAAWGVRLNATVTIVEMPVDDALGDRIGNDVHFIFPAAELIAPTWWSSAPKISLMSPNGAVGIYPDDTVQIQVVSFNPKTHEYTCYNQTVTVPAFSVQLVPKPPYAVLVTLTPENKLAVLQPLVVAYTSTDSLQWYPTNSLDPTCHYDGANVSLTCSVDRLIKPQRSRRMLSMMNNINSLIEGSWTFELYATVPSYFNEDLIVWLDVHSATTPWHEYAVRLQRFTTNCSVLVSADGAPPKLNATLCGVPSPARMPNSTKESTPASFAEAAQYGLFRLSMPCPAGPMNFLAITCAALTGVVLLRVLVAAVTARYSSQHYTADNTNIRNGPPPPKALAAMHAYIGVLLPCHPYCGPAHAIQLFAHILVMYAIGTTLLAQYWGLATGGPKITFLFGISSSVLATLLQPALGAFFWLYKLDDRRRVADPPVVQDTVCDFGVIGISAPPEVGVSEATVHALLQVDKWTGTSPYTIPREERDDMTKAFDAAIGESSELQEGEKQQAKTEVSVAPVSSADTSNAVLEQRYDPHTCARVRSRQTFIVGFVVCCVVTVLSALATAWNIAGWCESQLHVMSEMLLWMFLADVLVSQMLLIVMIVTWRWHTSKSIIHHPLHPIHGQLLRQDEFISQNHLSKKIKGAPRSGICKREKNNL